MSALRDTTATRLFATSSASLRPVTSVATIMKTFCSVIGLVSQRNHLKHPSLQRNRASNVSRESSQLRSHNCRTSSCASSAWMKRANDFPTKTWGRCPKSWDQAALTRSNRPSKPIRQIGAGRSSSAQSPTREIGFGRRDELVGAKSNGSFISELLPRIAGRSVCSFDEIDVLRRRQRLRRSKHGLQNIGKPDGAADQAQVECSVHREDDLRVLPVNSSL